MLAPSRLIERNARRVKRGELGDEMIIILRTRIDQRWRNARRHDVRWTEQVARVFPHWKRTPFEKPVRPKQGSSTESRLPARSSNAGQGLDDCRR